MENSTWSGACPHCGCPIEGVHYEGCDRNEGQINYSVSKSLNMLNEYKEKKLAEFQDKFGEDSELVKFLVLKYGSFILHEPYLEQVKQFISDLIDDVRLDTLRQVLPEKEWFIYEEQDLKDLSRQQTEENGIRVGINSCIDKIETKAKEIWGIDLEEDVK